MKRNKNNFTDWIFITLGLGLVVVGFIIHHYNSSTDRILITIPYILIALGCGMFGHFIGNIIQHFLTKNDKQIEKQIQIAKQDERNIIIAEKSKARAYDFMTYLYAAMLIVIALVSADVLVILILVAMYLSIQIYAVYWRLKLERDM